ncbi:MAG TPA: hypothetical protein VHL54_09150, partial [Actinomycetota bacterium]|nr:hypothetical protein [Actinomycetota bacterium]
MQEEDTGREARPRLPRRRLVQAGLAGLGGLAAARLLPGVGRPARAATVVTPDPLKAAIQRSGIAVKIVEFSTPPRTSETRPYALLNFLYHAGDGSGWLFANDSRGKIWLINRTTGAVQQLLDLQLARGSAFLDDGLQMGLRSFAFHPDFARSGRPGHRKLYTVSTETVASRPSGVRLFSGPFEALFHDVLAEWSVYPTGPALRVKSSSRREVLRIAQYKRDHNTDQLMFDPNAQPGTSNYGKLFIGIGDGGNNPEHPDPY